MLSQDAQEAIERYAVWFFDPLGGHQPIFYNMDMSGADLSGVNLAGAYMHKVNLEGTNLSGADLTGVNLRGANLKGADLRRARLYGAILSEAIIDEHTLVSFKVPIVPALHRKILTAMENGGRLNMFAWHSCSTTHCRAGWVVELAGSQGKALEKKIGPNAAGAFITMASCPYLTNAPDFYCVADEALADIRRCAAQEGK